MTATQPDPQDIASSLKMPIGYPIGLWMFFVFNLLFFDMFSIYWNFKNLRNLRLPNRLFSLSLLVAFFGTLPLGFILAKAQRVSAAEGHEIKTHYLPIGILGALTSMALTVLPVVGALRINAADAKPFIDEFLLPMLVVQIATFYVAAYMINKVNKALRPDYFMIKPYSVPVKVLLVVFGLVGFYYRYWFSLEQMITKGKMG